MTTLVTINHAVKDGSLPITAEPSTPGLAIAPGIMPVIERPLSRKPITARFEFAGNWSVVHLASGLPIRYFATPVGARRFATTLASWDDVDWTAEEDTIRRLIVANRNRVSNAALAVMADEEDTEDHGC